LSNYQCVLVQARGGEVRGRKTKGGQVKRRKKKGARIILTLMLFTAKVVQELMDMSCTGEFLKFKPVMEEDFRE
jgi:hypothetical protein